MPDIWSIGEEFVQNVLAVSVYRRFDRPKSHSKKSVSNRLKSPAVTIMDDLTIPEDEKLINRSKSLLNSDFESESR